MKLFICSRPEVSQLLVLRAYTHVCGVLSSALVSSLFLAGSFGGCNVLSGRLCHSSNHAQSPALLMTWGREFNKL